LFRGPISKKKKSQKRADGMAQDVGPEFKPQKHTHTKVTAFQSRPVVVGSEARM
jgi:hypothetical protein